MINIWLVELLLHRFAINTYNLINECGLFKLWKIKKHFFPRTRIFNSMMKKRPKKHLRWNSLLYLSKNMDYGIKVDLNTVLPNAHVCREVKRFKFNFIFTTQWRLSNEQENKLGKKSCLPREIVLATPEQHPALSSLGAGTKMYTHNR